MSDETQVTTRIRKHHFCPVRASLEVYFNVLIMLPKIFVFLLCAAQLGIYLAPTDSWAHTGARVGAAPCQDPGKVQQGDAEAGGEEGDDDLGGRGVGMPVPSPVSAALHLRLSLTAGLGHREGISKPKFEEKPDDLKFSAAPLPPPLLS